MVNICHHVKFVTIGLTFPRYGRFSIFQDGDRPPAWICCAPTLNYPRMAVEVFIVLYNLVGIDRVVVKI